MASRNDLWSLPGGWSGDRRGRVIVAALTGALVVVILAAVALFGPRPVFQSRTTLAIDQVTGIAASDGPAVIEKLSRLRLKYAGLLTTDVFSRPISDELDLPEGRVERALFSNTPPASLLLFVGGRDEDPTVARAVAETAAEQVVAYVEAEQAEAGIPAERRFTFTIVTPASQPSPIDRPRRRPLIVGTGLVLLASLAAGGWWLARSRS